MSSFLYPTGLTFIYKFSSQIVCFTYVFCHKIERYKFCNRMLMHLFGRVYSPIAKHLRNNRVIIFIIHWIVIAEGNKISLVAFQYANYIKRSFNLWDCSNRVVLISMVLCLSNYAMMYSMLYWIWLEFNKFSRMEKNLNRDLRLHCLSLNNMISKNRLKRKPNCDRNETNWTDSISPRHTHFFPVSWKTFVLRYFFSLLNTI